MFAFRFDPCPCDTTPVPPFGPCDYIPTTRPNHRGARASVGSGYPSIRLAPGLPHPEGGGAVTWPRTQPTKLRNLPGPVLSVSSAVSRRLGRSWQPATGGFACPDAGPRHRALRPAALRVSIHRRMHSSSRAAEPVDSALLPGPAVKRDTCLVVRIANLFADDARIAGRPIGLRGHGIVA